MTTYPIARLKLPMDGNGSRPPSALEEDPGPARPTPYERREQLARDGDVTGLYQDILEADPSYTDLRSAFAQLHRAVGVACRRDPAAFGRQAVYLEDAERVADLPGYAELAGYKREGIPIVAPPIFALLALDEGGRIVPSQYARDARRAGLDIIAWSLERSGVLAVGHDGFYLQTVDAAIRRNRDDVVTSFFIRETSW